MRKFYSLVLFLVFSFSFTQNLDWFYTTTGKPASPSETSLQDGRNYIISITINSDESVYIAGNYSNNVGFDESTPLNFQLISSAGYPSQECYIAKIDKNKKYLWHRTITIGPSSAANVYSVVVDKKGNIIVAGTVRGNNIDLDPNDNSSPIYNTDLNLQSAIFVNKYDKDGNFIYGSFYKGGHGIAKLTIDNDNNVIIIGNYTNYNGYNTDFDLSDQEYYLNAGSGTYQNFGFILKNDENGKLIWAKYIAGWNSVRMNSLKVDNSNNVLVLSNNESFFNFNGEQEYSNGATTSENYLCKIDKNGNFVWAQNFGGIYEFLLYDAQPFDIDTDDSIVLTTAKINKPIKFPNQIVNYTNFQYGSAIFKIDKDKNYLWHSDLIEEANSYSSVGTNVTIDPDHNIIWSLDMRGVYSFYQKNQLTEIIKLEPNSSISNYSTILKLDNSGKLLLSKHQIAKHKISRFDKANNKMYFSSFGGVADRNPDQNISDFLPYNNSFSHPSYVQKLEKCYSGTPDGDPYLYTCMSEVKKIKDLYPKTSYSSWYDSPTSTTPLSPETVLTNKKYYATTQDASCPFNPTRLEVDVRVFPNPPELVVPDFTFCNLQGKRILDLNINNNQNVEFYDDTYKAIYLGTPLEANKKYYVRQIKENTFPYWVTCKSGFTSFYVYDTSTPPIALTSQIFCKINKPKISDITVTATNPKWYDASGNVITNLSQELTDNTNYYVTQNSSGCESGKTEILIKLSDPTPPTGNSLQDFCSASNPILKDVVVTGTVIKWYSSLGILFPETTALQNGETYYASQTVNSCESTQKLAVKVNVVTNYLSANDFSDSFCNDTTANFKIINIDNYRKELITNPQDYTFEIRNSKGELETGDTNLNVGPNVFDVKITSSLGCFQFVKLSLTLNEKPKVNLPADAEFCDNVGTPLQVEFASGYSYLWNTGETSNSIIADKEQTYTVKVTTPAGCVNTASTIVKKAKLAEIQNIVITNNSAMIVMSVAGDYLYSLDKIDWKSSNKFENLVNGNYTVFVKTKLDCDLGSKSFTIFSLSNIFSPNGDGINDTWKISGIENYANSEIKIFDRQGKMVVNQITKGESFEWNGESNGRKLPSDSYWYQIKISDGRILEGYVVIKNRN